MVLIFFDCGDDAEYEFLEPIRDEQNKRNLKVYYIWTFFGPHISANTNGFLQCFCQDDFPKNSKVSIKRQEN